MRLPHAALIGALGVTACGPSEPPAPAARAATKPAVVDLEQLEALLAAKRGKGLLVNFWATW